MKLYISSYKLGNKTDVLKEWISKNNRKIALIPNSRDIYPDCTRKQQGIASDVKSLEELGFEVTVISLKDYFGHEERLRDDLKAFKAFFAIGGNTFALRQAMRLSGFDEYLKEISNIEDYLYGGYSAGICLLAPNIHGLELVDDPTASPYNCEVIFDGLGLLNYLPVCHYKSNHPESEAVNDLVEFLNNNDIKYITLHDGDVIIEDTCLTKK